MTGTASAASRPASRPPVPFLDLAAPYQELRREMDAAISRVLTSGWYLLGAELTAFEEAYARYIDVPHAVGVANGLDALVLALRALGVGPGDEVIVPSNTYIATWLAATQVGARPVPVEPDERTYNLDPAKIEDAVTPRTRVVLPVHLYGLAADMDSIVAVAARHGLRVLEDAAQAHGATYKGRKAGALGDVAAWSFYPGKNLGALGDGGGVTTTDAGVADRLRVLRNYGSRVKYVNEVRGVNSRLDDLQAAILGVKLRVLDEWNVRRARIAARYADALRDTPLVLPVVPEWATHAWHLYVVRVPGGATARDRVQRLLADAGVGTIIHYPIPPHRQQAYADLGIPADAFPLARAMADEVLSLPIGPHLTDEQQHRVIDALTAPGAF
jgi:dTDP-4-amino-4,6-dideoxygalactose transaminase